MTTPTDHIIVAVPTGWELRCGQYYSSGPVKSFREAQMVWQSRIGRAEFAKCFPVTAGRLAAETKDKLHRNASTDLAA